MSARTARGPKAFRRALIAAVIVGALAASTVVITKGKPWEQASAAPAAGQVREAITVPVERGTLTNRLRLNATLGYGDPIELPAATGVLTALPASGQVVEVGASVYESNGRPVILFEGARPFWRELSSGIDDGRDVLQLEQNLARLGLFRGKPDTRFDGRTTDAVRRWQKSLGIPVTGTVAAADVVVVNAPSIRVSQVTGKLGQTGVSPLSYTATTLRAVAKLTAAQARELRPGIAVTVVLPDGARLENSIAAVDPGGQPTGEEGKTAPPTALIEFPDQEQVADTGPMSIRVIVQSGEEGAETLIVPVTALIATAKESYAVEVRTGDGIVRVPVQIGLVADARVQIIASGGELEGAPADARTLAAGDDVVISR